MLAATSCAGTTLRAFGGPNPMRRHWLVAALAATLLLPTSALAQSGQVIDLLDGVVLVGQRGETDDLELSEAELVNATRRVEDLHAGIISVDPSSLSAGAAADELDAIVGAATDRLAEAAMTVDRCLVTAQVTAAACLERLFMDRALAIVIVGDFGDLVEPTALVLANRTIVVGIGGSDLADGAVNLEVDPLTVAREQGRAAGRSLAVTPPRRTGNALVVGSTKPRADDPVREAGIIGLRQTAPKVKVAGRVGPAEIRTVNDLAPLLIGPKPFRVVMGEGLILDGVDEASLLTLPEDLRLVAWTCSDAVSELLDLASRLRGCVARADDAAGEAAANAVLALKTSRDVPDTIEIPVYVYRGTVPVGPGFVELGRRFTQTAPAPTDAERQAAAATLADRTVGIVVPVEPGPRESESQRLIRTGIEDAVAALGGLTQVCVGAKSAARVCVADLLDQGVAMVVPIATGGDLTGPATDAITAGVPVVGVNEVRMGDSGAVYVYVNPRRVARLAGRMAGAYADRTWKSEPVEAVVFNDDGARADDSIASVVERALVQTDPMIGVVARLASKTNAQAGSAVRNLLKRFPSARIIVGANAAKAAPILIKKKNVNPQLVIYAQECNPDIVAAIDAGVDTGGRIKGCVDRDPAGAGRLAGDILTRVAGGSAVPEINEVQVIPYEPGLR